MNIVFKQTQPNQQEDVLDLLKQAAEKINTMKIDHWQYWKNPPPEKIKWIEEGINSQEFYFINTTIGDNIGMVRILDEDLNYWGKQKEKAKYIHSLVVKKEYNGKGVGAEVLNSIAKIAEESNCKFLRLDADANNPKLCSYYEKMGFMKVGVKALELSNYNLYQKKIKG